MQTLTTKAVNKWNSEDVQMFMLQVQLISSDEVTEGHFHDLQLSSTNTVSSVIDQLLLQYNKIFSNYVALPPRRGPFDHRIPLQPGTKPINLRPYRYSSMKKDIVETLVKDMLDQGVIQYINSPFSSPIVLVGKKDGTWRL